MILPDGSGPESSRPRRQRAGTERLMLDALQKILQGIEEGVHIVDARGRSVLYNRAMEEIEGFSAEEVLDKHLLEVFPSWTAEDSTLLTALETGRSIDQRKQSYLNQKKKPITTVNSTFPIFSGGKIIGAVEIAKNYTEVNQLSEKILDLQQKLIDPAKPSQAKPRTYTFDMLLGRHPAYLAAIDISRKAAKIDSSVLIEGETGTGKELFAHSIHNACPRRGNPFIAINCAAMPDTLLEGILFGTAKGSYTGAEDRPGLFEQAHSGTLFLDEINSMSVPLQAKILRVLQEGYVRRLGGLKDLLVDVRTIAASNEALLPMMKEGRFRKDLYYRLNVINIVIPPLRSRKDDIPLLVEHFIAHYNRKLGKEVRMLSLELQAAFRNHAWIGNVRELQNVLESAMAMVGDERVLGREHIPHHVDLSPSRQGGKEEAQRSQLPAGSLDIALENLERRLIMGALERNGSNISRAAQSLGLSRQSLQYKLRRLGISGRVGIVE